jgi:hypothetical protein
MPSGGNPAGSPAVHRGSCLCRAVTFEVSGPLAPPDGCHCRQCRKQSGHFFASTDVEESRLTIHDSGGLKWFGSSPRVRRGFCSTCGSSLFWDPLDSDKIAIAMGAFDGPTETRMHMHIFVAEKGDYYETDDGLPQHAR